MKVKLLKKVRKRYCLVYMPDSFVLFDKKRKTVSRYMRDDKHENWNWLELVKKMVAGIVYYDEYYKMVERRKYNRGLR